MARRTQFKLRGFSTWVDNIKNSVSEEAARTIVNDLQQAGPYWTGDFANAWVVKAGTGSIAASKGEYRPEGPVPPKATRPSQFPPVDVPKAKGRKGVAYAIGNEMVYRDVAMDLKPGNERLENGKTGTAEQDWYRKYVEGGNLRLTLQQVTDRVSKDPKIRGFKK